MSPNSRRDPVAADAFLHLLADQLLAGLGDGLEPVLAYVAPDGVDDLDVGVKPLDGHHPSDLLVGFTAPEEWHGLGLATRGFAYPIAERGSPKQARTRVDVVALVSRTGELAHRVHLHDDDLVGALDPGPDEASGEQIDLLRLALGLGTEEPPCGSDVYWTIEWLSELLGAEPHQLVTWRDVTSRHPAVTLLHHAGHPHTADPPTRGPAEDFVEVAGTFARICTWRRLRSMARDGRFTAPDLVPSDAAWFDDGGFARFLLSRCPPLAMLRAQTMDHLPPDLADRLDRTLDELDIPAATWPDASDDPAA